MRLIAFRYSRLSFVNMAGVGRDGLMEKFKELGIDHITVEHPEVFTVNEMMPHVEHLPGLHAKNLLLYDKKKTSLWLVSARLNADTNLNNLAKRLNAKGGLRFADESVLLAKLNVGRGCVTPFALINDTGNEVICVIDAQLLDEKNERVYFHPLVNSATTGLSPKNLAKFLDAINHKPTVLEFGDCATTDDSKEV